MNIPNGHQALMPYLILQHAPAFIEFTTEVFGATAGTKHFRDDGVTIMHAEISLSGSTIMVAEATADFKPQTANMFVYVDDADQTFEKAVTAGGSVAMELSDKDYGRTCGITDPFGNVWWITSVS